MLPQVPYVTTGPLCYHRAPMLPQVPNVKELEQISYFRVTFFMAVLKQLVENGLQTKLKHDSMRNFGMVWKKFSYKY